MKLCLNILEIVSILILVLFIVICVVSCYENRRFVVTEYVVRSKCLPRAFHGLHIVQISDLHNACFGKHNHRLLEQVRQLAPDLILVTGDMIVGKPGMGVDVAVQTMNALSELAPVYFSMGNHELRASLYTDVYGTMWEDFRTQLSEDIRVLSDESIAVTKGTDAIYLYGLNLTPALYKRGKRTPMPKDYLNKLFGACDETKYHIFLAHNPDYFRDYAEWGANLTFSGHVHGGMIRIPFLGGALSPMIHFFPKYDKGLFEYFDKYMILSGGLGNHTFKIRVNNFPEIVSVILEQETM